MFRRTVFKILVVCIVAAIAFLVFHERGPEMLAPVTEADAATLPDRLTGLSVHTYDSAGTPLYNDRRYHTKEEVPVLRGLRFVPIGRNEMRPFVLEVSAPTTVYTLANRADLRGLAAWTPLPDPVLVDDAFSPRRLDVVLSLAIAPGIHVVRNPENGPGRPVFFDPAAVQVMR
jgi:hypothetical protein